MSSWLVVQYKRCSGGHFLKTPLHDIHTNVNCALSIEQLSLKHEHLAIVMMMMNTVYGGKERNGSKYNPNKCKQCNN